MLRISDPARGLLSRALGLKQFPTGDSKGGHPPLPPRIRMAGTPLMKMVDVWTKLHSGSLGSFKINNNVLNLDYKTIYRLSHL